MLEPRVWAAVIRSAVSPSGEAVAPVARKQSAGFHAGNADCDLLTRRGAGYKLRCEHSLLRAARGIVGFVDKDAHRSSPNQRAWLPYRSERYGGCRGKRNVVEADHGYRVGDEHAAVDHKALQQTKGEQVVGREYRVGTVAVRTGQEPPGGGHALGDRQGVCGHDLEACGSRAILDRTTRAGETVRDLSNIKAPAHERDAPTPPLE
jgi:hypothetical protein